MSSQLCFLFSFPLPTLQELPVVSESEALNGTKRNTTDLRKTKG